MSSDSAYTLYTDGSCFSNPGPGGWAYVLIDSKGIEAEQTGFDARSTNNRMEMTAVIEGLKSIPEGSAVELHSDSTYVLNGLSSWIKGWRKKGFKKEGKDMPNADLWRILDTLIARYKITYIHVKGHSGDRLNEKCDQLAKEAIENHLGTSSSNAVLESESMVEGQVLFTDGACSKNPGPGGWAYVLKDQGGRITSGSGYEKHTTNNRMELIAVIEGIRSTPKGSRLTIFSDSSYVVNGMTTWIHGWRRVNFKRQGNDIPNADLWKQLDSLLSSHKIKAEKVKGHDGVALNEKCDELARKAIEHGEEGIIEGTALSPLSQKIITNIFNLETNKDKIISALHEAISFLKGKK